jgi:hypothetical protein
MSAEEVEKENFPILKAFVNLLRKPRLEKGKAVVPFTLVRTTQPLQTVLPQLFSDLDHDISRLGDQGKMDPFVDIYNVSPHLITACSRNSYYDVACPSTNRSSTVGS